jgi:hypothetical protein
MTVRFGIWCRVKPLRRRRHRRPLAVGAREVEITTMTREEFAALPDAQDLDIEITFDHGPERATIHHYIRGASVQYVLSRYAAFDSIRIF